MWKRYKLTILQLEMMMATSSDRNKDNKMMQYKKHKSTNSLVRLQQLVFTPKFNLKHIDILWKTIQFHPRKENWNEISAILVYLTQNYSNFTIQDQNFSIKFITLQQINEKAKRVFVFFKKQEKYAGLLSPLFDGGIVSRRDQYLGAKACEGRVSYFSLINRIHDSRAGTKWG